MSLIVNWRQIPPWIPQESAGIPEFQLIPVDSPRIPGGISGEMKSIVIKVNMIITRRYRIFQPIKHCNPQPRLLSPNKTKPFLVNGCKHVHQICLKKVTAL